MITLKQISAKINAPTAIPQGRGAKRARRSGDEEGENDPDWTNYLRKVQNEGDPKEVASYLLTEFQNKSKEAGAKCVDLLRNFILRTHRLAECDEGKRDAVKSFVAIFHNLFEVTRATWSVSPQVMDDMIGVGISCIRDCPSKALAVFIADYALEEMRDSDKNRSLHNRWVELFVRFITILNDRGDIPWDGDKIEGKEFRRHIVEEICRMDWTKPIVKSYLNILEEIPSKDGYEVDIILDKFGSTLQTMAPETLQSSVYQIVTITGNMRPAKVLEMFDKYFRELPKVSNNAANNNGPRSKGGKRTAASTVQISIGSVACNFVEACRNCDPIVREILKRVKASLFDHSLVTSPFILCVVLSTTNVDYMRTPIIDPLKAMIIKSFHEISLCSSNMWYKDIVGEVQDDITESFKYVLSEGAAAMEYMSEGVKELGMNLLNSYNTQAKFPITRKRLQELGIFLVTTVVSKNKEHLAALLKELLNPDSPGHIECLASCLNQCSRTVGQRDFQGRVSDLINHLPSMTVESASVIVKSLMPSLQISPTLLDELMIVLRKTFWKSVDAGRICVEVICVILSNSYVMGNSQIMLDVPADDLIFSQLTQGSSGGNGVDYSPLCREILNLGKRFFLLDCRVREQLYLGLHRVTRRNPMVSDIIAGQLFAHMSQYVKNNSEDVSFKEIFEFPTTGDRKAIIKDELGFLVQCIGFVYNRTCLCTDSFNDTLNQATSFTKCKELLEKLVEFAGSIDSNKIEIAVSDILDNCERTGEMIQFVRDTVCIQTLQIMEALVEFLAVSPSWPQTRQKSYKIYTRHEDLLKYMKECTEKKKKEKGKKGKGKEKKADTTKVTTQPDQDAASVASGSQATSAAAKGKKGGNNLKRPTMFHIINLDSVCQMLREIYGPENELRALRPLRGKEGFEFILLNTINDKVNLLKKKQPIRERQRAPVDSLNSLNLISETIWASLCKLAENHAKRETYRETTEVVEGRLKIIEAILEFFNSEAHSSRVLYFSKYQTDDARDETQFCAAFFQDWKNILQAVSEGFDGIKGQGCPSLFKILNNVCKVSDSNEFLVEVLNWCWRYLKRNAVADDEEGTAALLLQVAQVVFTCSSKCCDCEQGPHKPAVKLSKGVRHILGLAEERTISTQRDMNFWMLNGESSPQLICSITKYMETEISMLVTVLGRLKSHHQYLGNEKSGAMREKCLEIVQSIRQVLTPIVESKFPSGPCIPEMIKVVTQFYSFLASFTEHLTDVNKQQSHQDPTNLAQFKKLVADLGRDFKPMIEAMILYIEATQRRKASALAQTMKNPGKLSSRVRNQYSRETKLIPNMVYYLEKFDQFVIALSKKTRSSMIAGVKLSAQRDIRIDSTKLKDVFQQESDQEEDPPLASARPGPSTAANANASRLSRKRK